MTFKLCNSDFFEYCKINLEHHLYFIFYFLLYVMCVCVYVYMSMHGQKYTYVHLAYIFMSINDFIESFLPFYLMGF